LTIISIPPSIKCIREKHLSLTNGNQANQEKKTGKRVVNQCPEGAKSAMITKNKINVFCLQPSIG